MIKKHLIPLKTSKVSLNPPIPPRKRNICPNLSYSISLARFHKFENSADGLTSMAQIVEGKVSKPLKKMLQKEMDSKKQELAVCDKNLGANIQESLGITCVYDNKVLELMRGIRANLGALLTGYCTDSEFQSMSLGLSHTMSRHKLKFSPDKVDTMIVQAINLLDDLDKELNIYAMRVKEWYGWHFPELVKILNDNMLYAKCVLKIQRRNDAKKVDFSDVLEEEMANSVTEAIKISMGTEINEEDIHSISSLAEEVVALSEYRGKLFEYLKNRMQAIAPNLTHLVGELVGARLIAHAGSLMNLAKQPASTVQILGAEKALFRALKSKHNTPKYGLIYHASLIGQAPAKHKGKIARVLSAKCAISSRVDALGEKDEVSIGIPSREIVETRLATLEGIRSVKSTSVKPKAETNRSVEAPAKTKSSKKEDESEAVSDKKRKRDDEPKKEKKSKKE